MDNFPLSYESNRNQRVIHGRLLERHIYSTCGTSFPYNLLDDNLWYLGQVYMNQAAPLLRPIQCLALNVHAPREMDLHEILNHVWRDSVYRILCTEMSVRELTVILERERGIDSDLLVDAHIWTEVPHAI